MSRRLLITGASGFLGSHFVERFASLGFRVTALDVRPLSEPFSRLCETTVLAAYDDPAMLPEVLARQDVVLHCASTTVPSSTDAIRDVETNLCGALRLIEAMACSACRRLIYVSSGGTVYGDCASERIVEDAPRRPISSYGIVKVAIESYVDAFRCSSGASTAILRPSNPFGPLQSTSAGQGLVGTVIRRLMADQPIDVWGDGSSIRDYIYIDDLVDCVVRLVNSDAEGTFNVGSGIGLSVREVIEVVGSCMGVVPRVVLHGARPFDVRRVVLDVARAERVLGWRPVTPFERGVDLTVQWMQTEARST